MDIKLDITDNLIKSHSKIDEEILNKNQAHYMLKKKYSQQALRFSKNTLADTGMQRAISDNTEVSKYKHLLIEAFKNEVPLIYLNKDQKDEILTQSTFVEYLNEYTIIYQCCVDKMSNISKQRKISHFKSKYTMIREDGTEEIEEENPLLVDPYSLKKLMSNIETKENYNCFILLKGQVHCFDKYNNFIEQLAPGTFFGYEGPIFENRSTIAIAQKGTIICNISQACFLKCIEPFSKFCNFIQKSVITKDKFFSNLDRFKTYILSHINEGPIDLAKSLDLFSKINSCLHPKGNSSEIDFSAWHYAVERLPPGLFDVFCFNLVNSSTKVITLGKEVFNEYITIRECKTRMRNIFEYMPGKYIVVVRDMETDVLDFMSNMCIHISESIKLRNMLSNPDAFRALGEAKDDDDAAIKVIEDSYQYLEEEEKKTIKKIFGSGLSNALIKLCLHYQDYSVSIKKKTVNRKDPTENWIQNIWKNAKILLDVQSSVDEVDDLIVDIMQGSKTTLLACISPHLYINKDKILNWAKQKNLEFKTKHFLNENDRLVAASYYYYKEFPDEQEEKNKMNRDCGIQVLDETFTTGVQVMIINLNKLNPKFIDPNITFKTSSKNHLILHIGYTFGAQSSNMIKPILMLFGLKARSLNIIGKAGGLTGKRTDILVANKMFHDRDHDLIPINTGEIQIEKLSKKASCDVHLGPMLCVAGTILQNTDLLRYYKYVNGCVGLEMEGYYYVQEVDKAMRSGLLGKDFLTRCFYYSSDLPLDPTQNLSMEGENISWEEGVGSMLAIQRYILEKIFS